MVPTPDQLERPNLTGVDPEIVAYIEALEAALNEKQPGRSKQVAQVEASSEPQEAPTTLNVITISRAGLVKRTPRHLYARQRRGGMGIFDIDLPDGDLPSLVLVADEGETLLLFTEAGRAYRVPVAALPETPVRGRGQALVQFVSLSSEDRVVSALPADAGAQIAMVSERGQVRRVRASFVGRAMTPGMRFHDPKAGGPLVAVCWTGGDDDLFVATRQGVAIRFPEARIYDSGSLGIRVARDDAVVGITAVAESSAVFLLGSDGKGTLRLMSGFAANKSPGGSGKRAIRTDELVATFAVNPADDLFILSRLCKMIRFAASEIPPKEGVVQGVTCMALRADTCVAATIGRVAAF